MSGSFATNDDGPKPEKPVWVLELNLAAQGILSKLEIPWKWDPEALASLEALENVWLHVRVKERSLLLYKLFVIYIRNRL